MIDNNSLFFFHLVKCQVGESYNNMLKKCVKCPRGTYNNGSNINNTNENCQPCPLGTTTRNEGAISSGECQCEYDLRLFFSACQKNCFKITRRTKFFEFKS